MMNRKIRKSTKQRGNRTHGYGSQKKHRGGGSRGGRGMAGTKRQKKTWMLKYKPDHLGKRGFKSLAHRKLIKGKMSVNVRDLERLAAGNKELDLTKLGYDKVLGGGSIGIAINVKADYFTESAKLKIEKAKGKVIVVEAKGKTKTTEKEEK